MKKLSKKVIAARLAKKIQKLPGSKKITIIAVTGSVGKTSAKVAIGKLLSGAYQVRFSEDSYNTDIGLPLSFFGLKAPSPLWDPLAWRRVFQKINYISKHYPYDVVVLEMADDEVEDMTNLLKTIRPDIGVITAVAPVHMERLESMDRVAKDNWTIASSAKSIIYNADYQPLRKLADNSTKYLTIGLKNGRIRFENIKRSKEGYLSATLVLPDGEYSLETRMLGEQNLGALLAAAAVANLLGMPSQVIVKGLKNIEPINGRMKLLKGLNGSKLIDDSYNSSPDAVKSALSVFAEMKAKRKIAVLGNMNELGIESKTLHYEIGQAAAEVVDTLVVIGKEAEVHMVAGAKAQGMDPDKIKIFKTPYEIGHFLKRIVKRGDLLLIKGSQNGVFLEEATRILLDPSVEPEHSLVRQASTWRKRKRKAFGL